MESVDVVVLGAHVVVASLDLTIGFFVQVTLLVLAVVFLEELGNLGLLHELGSKRAELCPEAFATALDG